MDLNSIKITKMQKQKGKYDDLLEVYTSAPILTDIDSFDAALKAAVHSSTKIINTDYNAEGDSFRIFIQLKNIRQVLNFFCYEDHFEVFENSVIGKRDLYDLVGVGDSVGDFFDAYISFYGAVLGSMKQNDQMSAARAAGDDTVYDDYDDPELPTCEERGEDDDFVGGAYKEYYGYEDDEKITDYEWARMGKKYAQDLFNNGEIDQDELDERLDYYEDYSYDM